ncbi:Transmembrane 9 super member 2 [Ancistrocladus abbreviatus]
MAEALVQAPLRSQTVPQPLVPTQRIEELAVLQSKRLIPMTPSMPPSLAVRVEHCERVHLITVAKQVCIANCRECVFFLGVNHRPLIVGDNHKLQKRLTKEEVVKFQTAVDKDYYFQMYYDDLPLWGFLRKVDNDEKTDPSQYKYYLFRHINIGILYNEDRVIEINAQSDPNVLVDLTENREVDVEFTYIVKWKETDTPLERRMEKYSQSSSLPHHLEIHWFSIINSCATVLLLTAFLATILMRVLKNDFVRYTHDEETANDQVETGWKYIHGDVFRFPKYKSLLAAALGSGTQPFTMQVLSFCIFLILFSIQLYIICDIP